MIDESTEKTKILAGRIVRVIFQDGKGLSLREAYIALQEAGDLLQRDVKIVDAVTAQLTI